MEGRRRLRNHHFGQDLQATGEIITIVGTVAEILAGAAVLRSGRVNCVIHPWPNCAALLQDFYAAGAACVTGDSTFLPENLPANRRLTHVFSQKRAENFAAH
jgi:hypothetical protein